MKKAYLFLGFFFGVFVGLGLAGKKVAVYQEKVTTGLEALKKPIRVFNSTNQPVYVLVPHAVSWNQKSEVFRPRPKDKDVWFISFDEGKVLISCTPE